MAGARGGVLPDGTGLASDRRDGDELFEPGFDRIGRLDAEGKKD